MNLPTRCEKLDDRVSDSSRSANQGSFNPISLDSLPNDILRNIINYLDLYSISRLSRSSRSLLHLTRSDSLWRQVSRTLVGPWIYRSHLAPTTNIDHDLKLAPLLDPPVIPDWTLDRNCFPTSLITRPSSHPTPHQLDVHQDHPPFLSWYQFATRFLIPHFNYLGWHVSNTLERGQLILVTYDTLSGRLIAEEIKCRNLYALRSQPPRSSSLSSPSWLPLNHPHFRLQIEHEQYNLLSGIDSPFAGYSFDIFEPIYVSSPLFSISPFEPHFRLPAGLSKAYENMSIEKPKLNVQSWDHFIGNHPSTQSSYPISVIPRRADIRSRHLFAEDILDFVNHPGAQPPEFHSFTLASSPESNTYRVDLTNQDEARIRYQGGPRYQEIRMATILIGGRSYNLNATGMLSPVVKTPIRSIEYYSIDGPIRFKCQPPQALAGLEGIWVGHYGPHGSEFGKIIVDELSDSSRQITFIKLTGDPNVPAGQVSWKVTIDGHLPFLQVLTLTEAIAVDLTATAELDGNWLPGQGQVANTNFVEPGWIDVRVQLIKRSDQNRTSSIPSIEQIRLKWIQFNRVASFFKVRI